MQNAKTACTPMADDRGVEDGAVARAGPSVLHFAFRILNS
jgi:hypothetical protein